MDYIEGLPQVNGK
jgi:hypothetical protein